MSDDYKYTKEYIAKNIIIDGRWYTYFEVREALKEECKDD